MEWDPIWSVFPVELWWSILLACTHLSQCLGFLVFNAALFSQQWFRNSSSKSVSEGYQKQILFHEQTFTFLDMYQFSQALTCQTMSLFPQNLICLPMFLFLQNLTYLSMYLFSKTLTYLTIVFATSDHLLPNHVHVHVPLEPNLWGMSLSFSTK